jgi:hypothetical protein
MVIGLLTVELELPEAFSLKEKRMVLNRVRDQVRQKFNVAIAEVDENDVWNRAVLGVVTVSNEQTHCNQVLSKVMDLIETIRGLRVEDFSTEFI